MNKGMNDDDELAAEEQQYFGKLCDMVDNLNDELPCEDQLRRDYCFKCTRPQKVCLCEHLPRELELKKNVKIYIFQHPFEQKRVLRTTRILEACLSEDRFEIIKGRCFSIQRHPELEEVYRSPNTYVLYPSEQAVSLNEFKELIKSSERETKSSSSSSTSAMKSANNDHHNDRFNIIIIDGTWSQASGIFYTNQVLSKLKQIKIDVNYKSAYLIRTQPREFFLSTLETIAVILATIEEKPTIYDDLVKPLKALCDYQLKHGAQTHNSKEYLIFNGLYKKPISRKMFNKITKNSEFLQKIKTTTNNNETDNQNKNNQMNAAADDDYDEQTEIEEIRNRLYEKFKP